MASAPPRPASPLPSAKVAANNVSTLIPSPRAMSWLFTAARTCAPKRVASSPKREERDQRGDGNEEYPVDRQIQAAKFDRPLR